MDALRKEILELIAAMLGPIDNSKKLNFNYYKQLINGKTDEELVVWIREFLEDEDNNFYIEIAPDDEPTINEIRDAASAIGCQLEYPVYYQHGIFKDRPTPSRDPMIVGVIPVKTLQQTTPIKLKRGDNIGNRSMRTGQGVGKSRVVNISEPERNALLAQGGDTILKEFTGARADNENAKREMYRAIAAGDPVRINDLPNDPRDKTAMRTFYYYLIGACLLSDILKTGYLLPKTSKKVFREVEKSLESTEPFLEEINQIQQLVTDPAIDFTDEISELERMIESSSD